MAISLGTSDTLFIYLDKKKENSDEGHLFCDPLTSNSFISLLCYKNGSLPREKIKNECANGDWNTFEQYLEETPTGSEGYSFFNFLEAEIIPPVKSCSYIFNRDGEIVASLSNDPIQNNKLKCR